MGIVKLDVLSTLFYNSLAFARFSAQSFPTPMEEPKKVLRAQYLGGTEVQVAVGMNVINDAIDKVSAEKQPESWLSVNVSISPSVISIRPSGVCYLASMT